MGEWTLRTSVTIVLCFLLLIAKFRKFGSRPDNLPPGPPTLPILGNLHLLWLSKNVHLNFQKWADEYGPIYSLILGSKTLIVLSDRKVVKDLLDHRSTNYSSRPDQYVGQDLISGGYRTVFMKYDDEWRLSRKMIHSLLNAKKAVDYVPYQELELKQMLSDMIDRPSAFHDHVRRYSTSLVTSFVFGWRSPSFNDPAVKQIYDGFEEFAVASQVSASLLDYYPVLRKLPDFINPMSRRAKQLHKEEIALYKSYIQHVRERVEKGTSPACFCLDMFKAQEKEGFTDDWASYVTGTLLEAGSDTTASIFVGFIVAMVSFPEVQKKAQAEIDKVVGPSRLPTMDDELPYIHMVVKETLRFLPSSILGIVPHATTNQDSYNGYHIPANIGVMLNVWTLNNDPHRYPEPREFRPERYAGDKLRAGESANAVNVDQRDHFTFGAGRRVCPGLNVAERSLYLGIAQMLWALKFEHAKDGSGNDIPIDINAVTQGIVCRPAPFQCTITARNEERKKLAKAAWDDCEAMLKKLPDGLRSTEYIRIK